MTGKTQLRRAVQKKFASKADKQILIPGLLGAYIGAVWMVSVPGRPSFVYVRVHGNNSEVIEAFNDTVSPILNLAVVLTRDELTPNYYRVLRRDVAKYQDWYTPQIGYHATQHEFGGTGSMGADIVWIQKQQFTPLEVRPISTSGSSYQCFVDPEYYQWNAGYQFFSGGATPDLNFLRPGGQLQGLFLGVYMDGNTDALAYITGTQFTHTPWPDNFRSLIPTVPTSVGIPLAGILLTHEMSGINWSQIYDTRAILGNGGMTGSAASLPDAPSDGSIYGRKNATWTAVTGTGGGGIPDAPSDGSLYGRKNAGWTVVTGTGSGVEVDPLSLHLDQIMPQTFINFASGTGLMKVTSGLLGLDTNQYVTGSPWTGMGYVTGTPWTGMGYVTGTPWTGMGYITGSPGGDMLKSVYDPNNDGIIGIVQGGTNATGTAQARTNLGLGNSATRDVGTTSGTVAAGDDARFGATGTSSGGGCVARGWVLEPPILVLDTLTKSVRAKLGAAQTSAPVQFSAHFADSSSSGAALSEGSTFIDSTGTASVELVAHPTGSPLPRRDVVFVSAVNNDTIVQTVIIYLDDGGTEYDIFRTVIPAGQSWNSTETATVSGSATPGDMLKSVYDPDVNGIIAIAQGGTNASTAPAARTNLGLGAAALYGVGLTTGTVAPGNTKLDAWSAPDDNTNLNVSSSAHGLAPKGTTGTTQYWRQDWTLGVPVRTLHIPLRLADNTTAFVTGTTAGGDWRLPTVTGTIVDCGAWTDTAGVTGTAVIDIHKNGTTIMTTNKISIASGQKSSEDGGATQPTITAGGYAPNDILTVDKDAAHGFPALGLVVWVDLRES